MSEINDIRLKAKDYQIKGALAKRNNKLITNLEQNVTAQTDTGVAYAATVPGGVLPYAEVTSIGGMTYKNEDALTLQASAVTAVQSNSTKDGNTLTIPSGVRALDSYGDGISQTDSNLVTWDVSTGTKTYQQIVKRIVLDGTESWSVGGIDPSITDFTRYVILDMKCNPLKAKLCSHFAYDSGSAYHADENALYSGDTTPGAGYALDFGVSKTAWETVDAWKTYLAEQNASGTPVTVVYVLPEAVETDLSDLLSDDNLINVDGATTVTAVNAYGQAVPMSVTYQLQTAAQNQYHYTARWDKTLAQLERLNDAKNIPIDTTNFGYFGTVNPNYNNPFDSIYPWSGIKLCNIDLDAYQALAVGESITKCVKAWEGDPDFSYTDENGVWRYRPEFWGKSWDDGTYRYFDVTDKPVGGYVHYPESIGGRWHGRAVSKTINGEPTTCLLPTTGIPAVRTPLSTLHTYAKNYGATLDSIYSIDADTLLFVVEYATMNSQSAIGNGVSNLYRQGGYQIAEAATSSTVVKVLASAGTNSCIPGAIFDIGTSNGGNQVGSYYVVSVEADSDPTYLNVTLNAAVTVTTDNYWSVHGLTNQADASIGSKSGYIGTNGKCNAYYRGMVLYGNMWLYTLGAYKNGTDQHIWIAASDEQADEYDTLDTSAHLDTGLVLPTTNGYIQALGMLQRSGLLSIPPFCTAIGGNSINPIGDGFANTMNSNNSILTRSGGPNLIGQVGVLYNRFDFEPSSSDILTSARPRLKPPRIRVVGTTLIL